MCVCVYVCIFLHLCIVIQFYALLLRFNLVSHVRYTQYRINILCLAEDYVYCHLTATGIGHATGTGTAVLRHTAMLLVPTLISAGKWQSLH